MSSELGVKETIEQRVMRAKLAHIVDMADLKVKELTNALARADLTAYDIVSTRRRQIEELDAWTAQGAEAFAALGLLPKSEEDQ